MSEKNERNWHCLWSHLWFPSFILCNVFVIFIFFRKEILEIVEYKLGYGKLLDILLFAFGLFGFLLLIGGLLKPCKSEEKRKKDDPTQDDPTPLCKKDARIREYEVLNNSVWNRGRDHVTVQSILISGSLVAVSFVARNIESANPSTLMFTQVVLVGALSLIVFSCFFYYTTKKLNDKQWDRINEIERLLDIKVGHRGMYDEIKSERWFRLRRKWWYVLFGSLFFFYLIILLLTFVYLP